MTRPLLNAISDSNQRNTCSRSVHMAQTTKSTHDQRRQQQLHSTDGLSDFPVRKISQQVQSPERTRRIGQYSKEAIDTVRSNIVFLFSEITRTLLVLNNARLLSLELGK